VLPFLSQGSYLRQHRAALRALEYRIPAVVAHHPNLPHGSSLPGESMEDWIDRECEALSSDNWRCEHCTYAFSIDGGDDARTKLCAECEEEKVMWAQDDWEWIHDREPEEVFHTPGFGFRNLVVLWESASGRWAYGSS